jgi:Holliday junction resolvasome RuvABC endonuclease subunit
MIILGIDLSIRNTGMCLLATRDTGGLFDFDKLAGSKKLTCQWQQFRYYGALACRRPGTKITEIEDILMPILEWANYAHQVIIEEYSHGSLSSSMDVVHELGGIVKYSLRKLGHEPVPISPKSLKKFIAGNGNADKAKMLASVQAAGLPILDDNMADAFGLARIGHALQQPESSYVDYHHTEREALMAIKHPKVRIRKVKEKPALWAQS